jgi:uncharacterized protein (TIGR01244 family)
LALALLGCSSGTSVPSSTGVPTATTRRAEPASSVDELRVAELGDAAPVHSVGHVFLAGQPSEQDFSAIAERGVKTIVTLRKPEELDWNEEAAVRNAGMEFVAIPFGGPDELTDDVFRRVLETLREHGDEPLVLHCGRANRVGAVWMVHRVLEDGLGVDEALAEATEAGLRTPEYAEKAQDFIRRAQAADPN